MGVDDGADRRAGCAAVLRPALAQAAYRVGATTIGLVAAGRHAGENLVVDRVGVTYDNGQTLGDLNAPEQQAAFLVGEHPIPTRPLPEIVTRLSVDRDLVGALPRALEQVPGEILPVVLTTWALARLRPERRLHVVERLEEAASTRTVAWVCVEGVGLAPGIPTLGDRPASGHSLVGLTLFGGPAPRSEVLARCWSRGRWLAWLADS